MIQEFKEFINKGNLVDLAVAFVLGTAFAALVAAFIETMIDPLLGYITPGDNLASWEAGPFLVGAFVLAIIAFLAIALVIFFVVKAYNRMNPPVEEEEEEEETLVLLREIRDSLNR